MARKRMYKHTIDECVWCGKALPVEGHYQDFCSKDCAWKDGDDWSATERDKWAYYNEV